MLHAAKLENAPSPHLIQRIAEVIFLPLGGRVARVQNQGCTRSQKTDWLVSLVHALCECVGGLRGEYAIDPALHHRRWRSPAIGMNDCKQITSAKIGDMRRNRFVRSLHAAGFGLR